MYVTAMTDGVSPDDPPDTGVPADGDATDSVMDSVTVKIPGWGPLPVDGVPSGMVTVKTLGWPLTDGMTVSV